MAKRTSSGVLRQKIKRTGISRQSIVDSQLANKAWAAHAPSLKLLHADFAAALGTTKSFPSLLFNGRAEWKDQYKLALADILQCVPQDIFPDWRYAHMTRGRIGEVEFRLITYFRGLEPKRQKRVQEFIECQVIEQVRGSGLKVQRPQSPN